MGGTTQINTHDRGRDAISINLFANQKAGQAGFDAWVMQKQKSGNETIITFDTFEKKCEFWVV
jgi:hypothetical protein